jgi:catechol 2,3-dioxygenase-like lactoylglutathione lyase family enzyme
MSSTEPMATAGEALQGMRMAPALTVNDLKASLRFYTEGLGFEVEDETAIDGVVRFYMLRAGAVQLGIGQDDFAKGRDRIKGVGVRLWVTTPQDVHEIAARAKAAGITLDNEPEALPWGPMAFAVTDPDGYKFTIANDS